MDLDEIDRRILRCLQEDARIRNVDLAEKVGLSPSPCLRRVNQLMDAGVIQGYAALVDQQAVGLPVSIFINVSLETKAKATLEKFEAAISSWPEVMECYLMTGDSDYLLRVVTADLTAYERFLMDKLTQEPSIVSIKSSFALKQVVHRTALPVD